MDKASNKYYTLCICLVLTFATGAVYWQIRGHEFVILDDRAYISENEQVLNGLTPEGIKWAFTTNTMGNWHPLTWLSLMLDCQLSDSLAKTCHTTNLIFHIANTLLLFLVLKRMTGSVWPSAFVAALFALHPLHVESVAWASERKDVLSTFFWMLTMWAYIKYAERPSFVKYIPIVVFFILGLMAKPMLVTLPFVLLLLDYWPLGRLQLGQSINSSTSASPKTGLQGTFKTAARLVAEKVPLFALSAASCVITYLAQQSVGSVGRIRLLIRMANAVLAYSKYIWLTFWPAKLAAFYPYPHDVPIIIRLASALLLLLVSIIVILTLRRRPYLAVGWLWYLGTLIPVIGLVKIGGQAMADRYTYIPLTGLFIMIVWSGLDLVKGVRYRQIILWTIGTFVVAVLGICTWLQAGYWQNSIKLFEHTLAVTKDNYMAHYNLGWVLSEQGRSDESIEHYKKALDIAPGYREAIANLGAVLIHKGRIDEAIQRYRDFLKHNPRDYIIHTKVGDALVLREKIGASGGLRIISATKVNLDEAIQHYRQALQIKPDFTEALNRLKNAQRQREQIQ